jgi:hypothetical protein
MNVNSLLENPLVKVIATEKTGKGLERKRPYTYNYN